MQNSFLIKFLHANSFFQCCGSGSRLYLYWYSAILWNFFWRHHSLIPVFFFIKKIKLFALVCSKTSFTIFQIDKLTLGSGSKLDPTSVSGSKFNVFGSTVPVLFLFLMNSCSDCKNYGYIY